MVDFNSALLWWALLAWGMGFLAGFFMQFARRLLFLL